MRLSEYFLFFVVKRLYRTEIAHSNEMKQALSDLDAYDEYRGTKIGRIIEAARRYDIDIRNKTVVDFGCSDGAISQMYLQEGARRVIGVDIDAEALERARALYDLPHLTFCQSTKDQIPIEDDSVDVILSFDVFEHVARPANILAECHRILRPGGQMLIGTWGWYHPFAPHLWATMPVPWAHVLFSERTILRVCRQVYSAPWYVPNMHDLDANGQKIADKYQQDELSSEYVNKLLVQDFERIFKQSKFTYTLHPLPFGSSYARWTKIFLHTPWIREFITSFFWAVMTKEPAVITSHTEHNPLPPTLSPSPPADHPESLVRGKA